MACGARGAGHGAIGTLLLALLTGSGVVAPAAAQNDRTCRIELVRVGGEGRRVELGRGRIHQFGSGGVFFRCLGQPTTLESDSAAWYSELDRVDFVGRVRFRDSTATLEARRASYFTADERLEAYGDVRLVNLRTGSVLRGSRLTYLRAVPGVRDTTELVARERPAVEYRSGDPAAAPYVIVGDRVRLKGETLAWAGGRVTIEREDFAARGDSAHLDTARDEGYLVGGAEAAGRDSAAYTISGDRIVFRLTDDRLSWVQAQGRGRAVSADWDVRGDTVEFLVANDLIQAGSAWSAAAQAVAASDVQTITADSLAISAPDQVLTEVRAYRRALAESRGEALTGSPADTVAVAEPDWMAGDTIVARFEEASDGGRELVLLEAQGNARALYHIASAAGGDALAINYARGARITARFRRESLETVTVVDGADGVYLEPARRRRP